MTLPQSRPTQAILFFSSSYQMTSIQSLLLFLALTALILPACGGSETPTLGIPGRPTLVFIYTDG
jgi:hypothetical protein